MISRFKRFLVLAAILGLPSSAMADSWIFRQSYYSHDPVTNVRIGRQYAKGPVFTRPSGSYMTGGYRWLNNRINIGGTSYDNYNLWEVWNQSGEQF